MTMEIMGGYLDEAIEELGIIAKKTAETSNDKDYYTNYQVWELEESELQKLNDTPESEWKDGYGWYRSGEARKTEAKNFIVNGIPMIGFYNADTYFEWDYDEDDNQIQVDKDRIISFTNISNYYFEYLGISTEYNFVYFSTALAKLNNMKLSEFVDTYF